MVAAIAPSAVLGFVATGRGPMFAICVRYRSRSSCPTPDADTVPAARARRMLVFNTDATMWTSYAFNPYLS
jgi:hypothetical protein